MKLNENNFLKFPDLKSISERMKQSKLKSRKTLKKYYKIIMNKSYTCNNGRIIVLEEFS